VVEKTAEALDEILQSIMKSTAGIRNVILMDRTGLPISNIQKYSFDKSMNVERLGAIAGAVFQAVEEQGSCIDYGQINSQMTEYDKGFIFSVAAGDTAVLCIVTDLNVNLGMIRNVMKKYQKSLAGLVKKYLSQEDNTVSNEIRNLLNNNSMDLF
jgi:predicted regulator of Ras-like GTPase activity (Roadblock/LC7/MglB family)